MEAFLRELFANKDISIPENDYELLELQWKDIQELKGKANAITSNDNTLAFLNVQRGDYL
ncbi:MAG TPA: hypothetical protein VK105_14225 [Virgibacillus sp.]|nr:hypothetical protein [Virgibacillus sp.]HLR68263.1 hypothetical protein [Virgibacillus sp.]